MTTIAPVPRARAVPPSPNVLLGRAHGRNRPLLRKRDSIRWRRAVPYFLLQLAPLSVFLVGWSPVAVATAAGLYLVRMFAITGFYHRYFSHRAFRTSRPVQFLFALIGNASSQKGPLWWAAHHRFHHRHADQPADIHSPDRHGFWWSHMIWFLSDFSRDTKMDLVHDFARYPELRFLDRYYMLAPVLLAAACFGFGELLAAVAPGLGTDGGQMLVWGFFVSTFVLFHATYSINSLAHRFGRRRFDTKDTSRNNWWLALITLGEGWHNNHHRCPSTVRQGFRWWEIDITWYGLLLLSALGLVRDLRPIPKGVESSR